VSLLEHLVEKNDNDRCAEELGDDEDRVDEADGGRGAVETSDDKEHRLSEGKDESK
jgi:hypothetical protein